MKLSSHAIIQHALGFAVLVAGQWAGELTVLGLGLPLPGPLVGMVFLLLALIVAGRVVKPVALASGVMLRHMMLLLLPAVAGIGETYAFVVGQWLPFAAAVALGTVMTMVVTAMVLQALLRRPHGRGLGDE